MGIIGYDNGYLRLGVDLVFDEDGDLLVTPTGDLSMASGVDCLLQDVQDRLRTMPGDLWKHADFGCEANLLLGAPDTPLNRALAQRAIRMALEDEPRIDSKTIRIEADKFTAEEKTFEVHFRAKGVDVEEQIVIGLDN